MRLLPLISLLLASPAWASLGECTQSPWFHGSLGPLMVRSESPAQSLRLAPMPQSAEVLPADDWQVRLMSNVSSIYARDDRYTLDYHSADLRLGVTRAFEHGWQVEWQYSERHLLNAHLDQLTLTFHELFGIDQNGRDEVEKNRIYISFPELGIEERDGGLYSRNVGFVVKRALWGDPPQGRCLSGTLSLQTETLSDGAQDAGDWDVGLGLSGQWRIDGSYLHGHLAYTWFAPGRASFELPLQRDQVTAMLAVEFPTSADQAWLIQYLYSEGVVIDFGELSRGSHEMHLGYKWAHDDWLLELSLVENLVNFNNTPDIGFTLGVSKRF